MNEVIGHVARRRDTAPESMRWKRVGRLLYDFSTSRATLYLHTFTFGAVFSRPKSSVTDPPFIQGDILYAVDAENDSVKWSHVGFVTTSEDNDGPIYVVTLEAMPLVSRHGSGMWLEINDDADERRHKQA